ncbi:MAG: ribonuclease HII [Candidatus Heimdallarchaeota archaeon]
MYVAGIDEAGRGPVLGPLVIAGVVLLKDDIDQLVEDGLKDSKLLSKTKREQLYKQILVVTPDYQVTIIKASKIDEQRANGINLNKIEIAAIIELLNLMKNWDKAYVDACDTNAEKFELMLRNTVKKDIIAEHYADLTYPVVSAASVIAKVIRDSQIEKAQRKFEVDFGSGYPSDPKTIQFLKDYYMEHKQFPGIARKSWETIKNIIREQEQSNLDEFFSNSKNKKS